MTSATIIDFGAVKFIAPPAISDQQWSSLRSALSLATRDCQEAANLIIEGAGLLPWPPKRKRTTRPWSEREIAFVLANHAKLDSYRIGLSLDPQRSATAVESFLAQRGLKAKRIRAARTGSYDLDERVSRPDDAAHVARVLAAREWGFGPRAL